MSDFVVKLILCIAFVLAVFGFAFSVARILGEIGDEE